ncbi:hypothetical protein GCM10008967_02380 [Bacillus carboniphilus]|uniref:BCE-2095-like N-terminal domain-containing protein n=1 Tax=Bacillus carboniphilus TaxID=86663 RepID=A0ABN0VRE2_9BACI
MNARFLETQKNLFQLFAEKKYQEALHLVQQAEDDFPSRIEKTYFWKACVYARLREFNKAVDCLNAGLEEGIWWNPHTLKNDPDFKEILNMEEFQRILDLCIERVEENNKSTIPKLQSYGNLNAEVGIFSIHWRGSSVEDYASYWLDEEMLKEYYFAFPQSSQVHSYNAYCWDNSEVATHELSQWMKDLKKKNPKRTWIVAGASQGGKIAIERSLLGLDYGSDFIAAIPAISEVDSFRQIIRSHNVSGLKGVIITGDQDYFFDKTKELSELLNESGVSCRLIVRKGLGHFFPEDFTRLVKESVVFIKK